GPGSDQVTFEYNRYDLPYYGGGAPQLADPPVYVGRATRANYPDGTSVYTGYDQAEEPSWIYRADGTQVTLHYDSLHRVYQVDYPATATSAAFSVSVDFDEFGRVVSGSDA